jgi:hypothetical protein
MYQPQVKSTPGMNVTQSVCTVSLFIWIDSQIGCGIFEPFFVIVQWIFLGEAVIKVAGFGFSEYIQDDWNKLDFLVVLSSVLTFIMVRADDFRTMRWLCNDETRVPGSIRFTAEHQHGRAEAAATSPASANAEIRPGKFFFRT